MSFNSKLIDFLKTNPNLVDDEGELLVAAVQDRAWKIDHDLVKLLISDKEIKDKFFYEIEGHWVFNTNTFLEYVSQKNFLDNSYTRFRNRIGLTIDGKFLKERGEVALVWAYKDCVLEGGQTKEEENRKEIFFNEILAQDEINRLYDPKVLTNFTRYTTSGKESIKEIKHDENGVISENLIMKGNNLLVLHTLKNQFLKQIKLICIDPPYNRENDDFKYNDSFTHSSWLTFMKSRLEISRQLLQPNGTIFIFCDDQEHAYLRVLMDEIFGRERFITTIVWRNSDNSNNDAKQFSIDHNYILVYSNNEKWESIKLDRTEAQAKHYKNPDNDPRGPWFDGNPVNSPNPRKNLMYDLESPNGNLIPPPPNGWRWELDVMKNKIASGEIRFTGDGNGIIRRTYLKEQKNLPPSTLWEVDEKNLWADLLDTGHTRQAKYEQKKLFPQYPTSELFRTPKPEKVISKIIQISTYEGDYVLDSFGGSGTTAAVALKMSRKFITCEQMDYIHNFTIERLNKVVAGEQGGISKCFNWIGGGDFIYCELMKYNEAFMERIQSAQDSQDLLQIWRDMAEGSFLNWYINPQMPDEANNDFIVIGNEENGFKKQKQLLAELLDKNQLYVNLSEIDDAQFNVSEEDKAINKAFYGEF